MSSQLGFERLFELERGLRSTIKPDQLKALSNIPDFIQEYQENSDIIEACLLRVFDYFKARSMERRLDTIQFLETELSSMLTKIKFKSEELIRRLVAMWEINDSLMRSLIMRWFCILKMQLANSPDVFYRVGQSLTSDIREEYLEAIKTFLALSSLTDNPMLVRGRIDWVLYRVARTPTLRESLLETIFEVTFPHEQEEMRKNLPAF